MSTPQVVLQGFPQIVLAALTDETLKIEWNIDPFSQNITLVLKQPDEDSQLPDVIIGSIVLELNRLRSMMDVLSELSRVYSPELVERVTQRTIFIGPENESKTVFQP